MAPPEHVVAAFGLAGVSGEQLRQPDGRVWRYDDSIVKPVGDPVAAAWTAGVFESLRVSGIRIPRPIRSLDGRWVVGGWCAQRFVSGRPAGRYADIVEASFLLHEALADVPRPRFLTTPRGLARTADCLAWGETDRISLALPDGPGADAWNAMADGSGPVTAAAQVIHGDLFGNVLFAGSAPPAVIDFRPLWRPAAYAAATLSVDAVTWGAEPLDFLDRWASVTEWWELVRRAVLYRLAMSLVHPRSTPESMAGILRTTAAVAERLS